MEGNYTTGNPLPLSSRLDTLTEHHQHSKSRASSSSSNNNNDNKKNHNMLNILLAGGIGGSIGDAFIYPLDTVKTRQQGAPGVEKYKTMSRATTTILRQEGFRGVYGGLSPAILGAFPATMLFFGAYEGTKRLLIDKLQFPETISHFSAGFFGDFASSFIYVPSEVLKTRLQLQGRYNNPHFNSGYNYKNMTDATRTIVRTEGYGALFYGYKATLIRDLPFSALQFAFYEEFHQWAQNFVGKGNDMGIGLELATGALAGGLSGVITTPLDVVKTRIQTQVNTSTSTNPNRVLVSNSALRGLKTVYITEGIKGVFAGVGPRLFWTTIQSSVMLLIYQESLKFLEQHW